jgi:uncharacterized Zn finger protein
MFYSWKPYVPVAERRRLVQQAIDKSRKKGEAFSPVRLAGTNIASTFWGKAWCSNLERYSDYANRLPRGRTYVRNGSVIDLRVSAGEVAARVFGSSLYKTTVTVSALPKVRWKAITADCAGSIDSLVELMQGRLSKSVMERMCRDGTGLFPAPQEIRFACSCPDWAAMCKHVAAVLYGIGARLDENPQLLFTLRKVDATEMIARAGEDLSLAKKGPTAKRLLDHARIAAVFGIEMADAGAAAAAPARGAKKRSASPAQRAVSKKIPAKRSAPVTRASKKNAAPKRIARTRR